MKMEKYISLVLVCAVCVLAILDFGCGSIDEGYLHGSCIESEKEALLLFQNTLAYNNDYFNYLSSWVGENCCAWPGIVCDNITNHVTHLELPNAGLDGKIHPCLLDLKYLTYLDLSYNSFDGIQIPEFFGSFENLIYLNLSHCNFEGLVPHHLGNLSNLQYLDLSYNSDYSHLRMDSMWWLSKLSLLEHLDLSSVDLSGATDWFSSINMLSKSISVLDLSSCQLSNTIPHRLPFMNLTSLVSLYLTDNFLNSYFPSWVLNMSNLAHLSLWSNNFYGPIPKWIGSLSTLSLLDLSENSFQGSIPQSITNLTSLSKLALSNNIFKSDTISPEMGNLTELIELAMESIDLRGCLPETLCQLSKLERLDVGHNRLTGNIPKCIGKLSNLNFLGLLDNSWEGFITEHHLINLTRLAYFSVSSDSKLSVNISLEWVPPFQLEVLRVHSLKLGPKFPHWLLTQTNIDTLLLSNTSISDTISNEWFLSLFPRTLFMVDLSNNDIYGELSSLISRDPSGLLMLILSNNRLSGEIPSSLCNQTSLATLALSNNNFSGELPRCLGNLTRLQDLDLMNNSLSGKIPSLGSLGSLQYLNLHNNKFQGKLPLSFQNLTELFALDVGKNNLSDVLPPWTAEQLPYLKYLILRSNNFYGEIPTELCQHASIEVLNLADNQITGNIPSCFGNFSAMVRGNITSNVLFYWGVVEMVDDTKGYEQHYTSTLQYLFSIDLSNNNISGEIPKELMDLRGLLNLNLAGNHLAGKIPDEIEKLKILIYLDLSRNELHGPIPHGLSNLNFLSQLNLSFNDLSGRIPSGNQLQTLNDPSIYAGNDQLCGHPILKTCAGDTESNSVNDHNEADTDFDSDDEHMWFFAGLGPGFAVGFLGFCAALHFSNIGRLTFILTNKFLTR